MIQNNSFCPVHMNKQITHICIANHKCQRKVCGVCKHEKYANKNEIILLEDFCERLKTKANSLIQNDQDSAFISLRMSYKLMLGQIEKQIKAILEEFNQQIILMFDEIKKINDYLLEISQIDDNRVHECSQTDLINFIEIISGQYLDLQNQKIESKINLLKSTKQNADNEFSNFYHKLVNILSELKGCKKSKFEIIQEDIWQIGVFEEKGIQRFYDNLQKTKFIVEYTSMGQIKYIKDGICLKIENVTDSKRKKDIIRNLEQIQHLKFEGQYRNGLRFGKWNYIWKGLNLTMGGYYDNQGQKKGMWMELFENYWEKSQITFQGIYKNGQRFDKWDYKYLNETVGGGVYDEFGIKNGCWIELYEKFNSDCQVKFEGKYYNGQKVQKWDIILNGNIIGGGKYDENETKQGAWIDLFDNFSNRSEVTEIGEYQNGYRFGKWQIVYSSQQMFKYYYFLKWWRKL
ncbi:unnamed protein product [Paramecium sonneborni]|uniref:Uncharacterized protein n=1 Tax=Paramecium sonneborni TaxID=65129 RepID=A0A8S1PP88_9CILI|nr:unnamed protein product [Paramecium sonneborni]